MSLFPWSKYSLEELEKKERRAQEVYDQLLLNVPKESIEYLNPEKESSALSKILGERFIHKVEEEGDEEEAFKKFLRVGLRQPGTTKETLKAYLKRYYEKAKKEGRI